jgi:hypothetical protein
MLVPSLPESESEFGRRNSNFHGYQELVHLGIRQVDQCARWRKGPLWSQPEPVEWRIAYQIAFLWSRGVAPQTHSATTEFRRLGDKILVPE